ncbi:MOSC N-terminal beta barrel domain-containing protein [Streptomyces sp. W1SF4]|uniref:MOSC domain-containing protein n=1 Tax=Streptomyces sp. W1SF4 TaxID=2305220 RepID=UPI000F6BB3E4|nr:MOSC N-terminal beta barrel domain-containing protein [Streptomyces sp. W1SF4]AZM93804.1 MOSC domain-containing protein [Streptomyces sp. W1SF4]
MDAVLGTVERIWRYPVKSTGGEAVEESAVDPRGLVGDRLYAVRDAEGKFGSGKSTRRFRRMPGLLQLRSRYPGGAVTALPELLDPDGAPVPDPTAFLRHHLRRTDVELSRESDISHFDQLPLSLLATATLDWIRGALPEVPTDERRFRPNLLVRTPPGTPPFVEDTWLGRTARIGESLQIRFERASERCVMTNEAQPGLPHSPAVLRTIATAHDLRLDALATVVRPGRVRAGDPVRLADA